MSKPVSVSLSPAQQAALTTYRFGAQIADNSKALREIQRAGLEALAASADPIRAAAAQRALAAWPKEETPE